MTAIEYLNTLDEKKLREELFRCSGSEEWVEKMIQHHPFQSWEEIAHIARDSWFSLPQGSWKKAFLHHPKIGDKESLKKKFTSTTSWSKNEQSGVQSASNEILDALHNGNEEYEQKFGYIFIICATGKSAEEMLSALQLRLQNLPEIEIEIAASEHLTITLLRLEKLGNQ